MKQKFILTILLFCFALFTATSQSDCQQQINALQLQKSKLISERSSVLNDLKHGKFCSECYRSIKEIERTGVSFQQHLKDVSGTEIPASPEVIKVRKDEYDKMIKDIDFSILDIQRNCNQENSQQYDSRNNSNNNIDNTYNPQSPVDNTFNPKSPVDNRYNTESLSNNKVETSYEKQTGSKIFVCCDNEYTLNYTIAFEQQNEGYNAFAGSLDNTNIIFSIEDANSITIEKMKILYRLSLNLGEQGKVNEIILKNENLYTNISLGASRFRDFTIEKIEAKCNPHYQGETQTKSIMNSDNGLEITYTVTYVKRNGVETVGSDYYEVQGYLKNHYNKTIEYTYIAGTLSIGLDLINIKASNLLPKQSVSFKIDNASVIAGCDFPVPEVKMPVVVFKK